MIATLFEHHDLLTARAQKWLAANPERASEFAATASLNQKHWRALTFNESQAQWHLTHKLQAEERKRWLATNPSAPQTNEALLQSVFSGPETYKALGLGMAAVIHERANRGGFMRRFFYTGNDFNVPEFPPHILKRAQRYQMRAPHMTLREIGRLIQKQ